MFRRLAPSVQHHLRSTQLISETQIVSSRTLHHLCSSGHQKTRLQNTNDATKTFPEAVKNLNRTAVFPRWLTTEAEHTTIAKHDSYLEVHHEGQVFTVPYMWLRDHCRCGHCFNDETKQKNVNHKLVSGSAASKIELEEFGTILKIHCECGFLKGL